MTVARAAWLLVRCLRWLFWVGAAAYFIEFAVHRGDHLTPFGHLLRSTEFWMFTLPIGAVFLGFLELMLRERTGVPRPALGRNWLGQ